MAVAKDASSTPVELLVSLGRNQSTKTLLKVIILGLIAAAAVASRLFSVIRK
jgi:dolichyl-diphosphooligosaccharide--protein glycosyltransferase